MTDHQLALALRIATTLRALPAKVRRQLRARLAVTAQREGSPYCLACQMTAQCDFRGACVRTGAAIQLTEDLR